MLYHILIHVGLPAICAIIVFIAGYAILNTYEWIRDIDFRLKLVEGGPGLGGMPDVYSMFHQVPEHSMEWPLNFIQRYSFPQPRAEEDAEPQPETTVDVKFEEEALSPEA
jgi:hypothetical protein